MVKAEYQLGDQNDVQLKVARKCGIKKPLPTRKAFNPKGLTRIETCKAYRVDPLTHSVPYLTPNASALLDEIAKDFQKELKDKGYRKHRIIVTSVLRTEEDVRNLMKINPNAQKNSAHRYGTTFDITYIRFQRQSLCGNPISCNDMANILGKVLKRLRKNGRCYVKFERSQHCFHITSRM